MSTGIQVVIDCADPERLARFWAAALGYQEQRPPEGFASWEDWATDAGIPPERWNDASAVVDPDGVGPRLYFQRVPEGKVVKNRVHLDLKTADGLEPAERSRRLREEAERLKPLGATELYEMDEPNGHWITMQDPEGNEFCVD